MNHEDQFIPHLIVNDGMAALKFYQEVFGAEEGHNMMAPDGKRLMHGELVLDGHKFFVSDEFRPEEGGACKTPQTLGGTSVRITLMTDDPDGVVERAVERGRSEEHTSELQSQSNLVCRLLLEKKKNTDPLHGDI